jgi:hypothetical protein
MMSEELDQAIREYHIADKNWTERLANNLRSNQENNTHKHLIDEPKGSPMGLGKWGKQWSEREFELRTLADKAIQE